MKPPKNAVECWAYCYFAAKCLKSCSIGEIGTPPNCVVNGGNQCQGQFQGGASFSANGGQCQCGGCQGINLAAPTVGIKTLWTGRSQGCAGNPLTIDGKQHGNLGQFDSKDAAA